MTHDNPIASVGHAGLLVGLVASAYAVMASVAGARRGERRLERSGMYAAHASTAVPFWDGGHRCHAAGLDVT